MLEGFPGMVFTGGILPAKEGSVKDYLVLAGAHPMSNYRSAF